MQASELDNNSPKSKENTTKDPDSLPRRLERYTLLKSIARGGMGEVYLGTAGGIEGAERPCVVKAIRREHVEDRSFLARFLDEARIQAQLQHPGVAQILEASSDASGKPYVVVEHVEGHNLGDVRARAAQLGIRIAWPEALAIAISMADALVHVHERTDAEGQPLDIVHRDLSPQNVMVSYAGDVKLIDFGTARGQNRRCQTIAGIVFAKPGYVAPEVANNTPGGVPADLYAFGIMLWELLSGRRFLSGEASAHLAAVGAGKRSPSPLAEVIGAPREIDGIVARLTAPRVEDRYSSARHAVSALVRLMQRAPSMADGDRSVRGRIAQLMQRLYPAEPARSRAEFAKLVSAARERAELAVATPEPAPPSQPEVDASLLPGTRYRLGRELGRGGMGVVYEAEHLDLGRSVALKVLERESLSADAEQRFKSEARAIAQLSHDNLVKLYDFGVSQDGRPFYAMERLRGESLDQKLSRERGMDYRELGFIGIQACRALEAAHEAGVVHRDIKPANLFLTHDGKLKLLDFGVAKAHANLEQTKTESTGALSLVGTPEYMAPEQAAGGVADERSDLYALGVVLYELMSGHLPHRAENTVALLDQKQQLKPEPLGELARQRGIPKSLERCVMRALCIDPERRYASAREFAEALQAGVAEPERTQSRRLSLSHGLSAFAVTILLVSAGTLAVRPELRAHAAGMLAAGSARVQGLRATLYAKLHARRAQAVAALENAHSSAQLETARATLAAAPVLVSDQTPAVASPEPAVPATDSDDTDEVSEPSAASAPLDADSMSAPHTPELEQLLANVARMKRNGGKIRALWLLRRAARQAPGDARVWRELASAAEDNGAWGEAVRAGRQRVAADPSVEAKLDLARLERKTGHREAAVNLLRDLLSKSPDSAEARSMLEQLGGLERVALQK